MKDGNGSRMGPRMSRRRAIVHLPIAKRIFDVDVFLRRHPDGTRGSGTTLPIQVLSTGKRINHDENGLVSELVVHFWAKTDDKEPQWTEVVHLPSWWMANMYLAAILQSYAMHDCICIQT